MKNWLTMVLLATFALTACAAPNRPFPNISEAVVEEKTILVVRHLQKAQGDDPSLSDEGAAGAERLAELLADKGIAAIFATQTRRAMETAGPLARRIGVAITPYDPANPEALVPAVAGAKGSVLIVGHSNTVHDLIGRLGGDPPAPLTDQDYGTIFMIDPEGTTSRRELD